MLKWCYVLCELVIVTASFNVSYEDTSSSVCVRKILSRIAEFKNFTTDVSLINNEDDMVKQLQSIQRLRFITRTQSWANNEIYNGIYVMHFKDYNAMKQGFAVTMNDYYWTPISNFIIILEDIEDNLANITKFLVFNNLYNVTILRRDAQDYTIYTFHSPTHPCDRHKLVRVTQCSLYNDGSFIPNVPDVRDFRSCRFKLAAHNFYPMVNLDNNKLEGLEQRIVQLFSERHNMVIDILEYYKIDNMGRIVGNYSYVDMLEMVHSNKVEGVFGGFFLDSGASVKKFFYAYPIVVDHMVLIMPRAKFYNSWQVIFHKAFYIIMLVFSVIILFSVLAHLLALFPSREADIVRDFFIVFGYFLNKITVRDIKKGVAETLIMSSLLFSVFIIPFTLQAFLSSVQTHPTRGFEVKMSEDITENYQLIVPHTWTKNALTENSQACVNRLDCLNKVMNCKDRMHYTMISELLFDTYQWLLMDRGCNPEVYKLKSPVLTMMRTFYFRSGSVLTKPFDRFMLMYVSSGHLQKHTDQLVFTERLKCRYRTKPLHTALNFNDIRQSFSVLICGYCLSVICFLFEVLIKTRQYRM